jgi:hypothetical protein
MPAAGPYFMHRVLPVCLALAACVFAGSARAADEVGGFQIDQSAQHLSDAEMASLHAQLGIVDAVGLPPPVLTALKTTPIVVAPELRGNPGIFAVRNGVGAVYVRPMMLAPDKPILLHELLHAYHFKVLGIDRPEVRQAYAHARRADVFPVRFQGAHFLENEKEFFAVTATLYLFGDIQQPPFSCTALDKLDKDYVAFLSAQFGAHECNGGHGGTRPTE